MNLNLAPFIARLTAAGVAASSAATLVNEAVQLIALVEQISEGVAGSTKFQAVMDGLKQVAAQVGADWPKVGTLMGPVVNLLVRVISDAKGFASLLPKAGNLLTELAADAKAAAGAISGAVGAGVAAAAAVTEAAAGAGAGTTSAPLAAKPAGT